jgi:hypothetical protein
MALKYPPDDWSRTWAADMTTMLRRTSKRIKEEVDKMRLPAVVRLSMRFWAGDRNGTAAEKLQFIISQLLALTGWCLITSLELPSCQIKGFVDIFEDFLSIIRQCTGLAHSEMREQGAVPSAVFPRSQGQLLRDITTFCYRAWKS